ncbi:hypothetical protein D3C77_554620 [compost metagenome]
MHSQHDPRRHLPIVIEDAFQHLDDEIHWRVIVIEHDHLIHRWRLQFRLGFLHGQAGSIVLFSFGILIEC